MNMEHNMAYIMDHPLTLKNLSNRMLHTINRENNLILVKMMINTPTVTASVSSWIF